MIEEQWQQPKVPNVYCSLLIILSELFDVESLKCCDCLMQISYLSQPLYSQRFLSHRTKNVSLIRNDSRQFPIAMTSHNYQAGQQTGENSAKLRLQ